MASALPGTPRMQSTHLQATQPNLQVLILMPPAPVFTGNPTQPRGKYTVKFNPGGQLRPQLHNR